jgi:hypothetical protein
MGEQLGDGAVAQGRARQVGVERIGEVEPALVAKPQHQRGGEGLADRADAVLGVGARRRAVHAPAPAGPHHAPVADHGRHHRGEAPFLLLHRDAAGERAFGGGHQLVRRHALLPSVQP